MSFGVKIRRGIFGESNFSKNELEKKIEGVLKSRFRKTSIL